MKKKEERDGKDTGKGGKEEEGTFSEQKRSDESRENVAICYAPFPAPFP